MKLYSSNYAEASKLQKVAANSARGSRLSIHSPTLATGKDGAHAIVVYARIFSICAGAPSSTICMFWLVPSPFWLSFNLPLDYLTDALGLHADLEDTHAPHIQPVASPGMHN